MDRSLFVHVMIMWLLFIPVPVLNGFLREFWYKKRVGERAAHLIGSVIVSMMFLIYTDLFLGPWLLTETTGTLLSIGAVWTICTIIFEIVLGKINHLSWTQIMADYNLCKGRVWLLVLLVIFCAPLIVRFLLTLI